MNLFPRSEEPQDAADKHLAEIDLIRRRHQIYIGLAGKELDLRWTNPPGRTDCESFIAIPVEDPEAGLIHQHEWQHVFFKTDLRARAAFVESYLNRLESQVPEVFYCEDQLTFNKVPGKIGRRDVEAFLHEFINGLDDIRVCSLWEEPYPQSAEDIQTRWKRILLQGRRYEQDLTHFTIALGLGLEQQLGSSLWMRYKAVLLDGVEKVKKQAFPACLIVARWVMDSLIEDVLNLKKAGGDAYKLNPPPPLTTLPTGGSPSNGFGKPVMHRQSAQTPTSSERAVPTEEVFKKLIQGSRSRPRGMMSTPSMMDTDVELSGPDPHFKHTKQVVDAAMGVSTDKQVQFLLHQAQLEIEKILNALKGRTKRLTPDQHLLRGLEGSISFLDVRPDMVDEQELTLEDQRTVQTLRHKFLRLMDRKRHSSTDTGVDLNPNAYMDLMLGSGDSDIFSEEVSSRGFSSLILVDMSGSMMDVWSAVSRACKVLAKSMKFPFSALEVWGFSSDRTGEVTLFRFEDTEKGYSSNKLSKAWGLTPLHITTEVAVRKLRAMPGSRHHLFVLTDGVPIHISAKSGYIPAIEELISLMASSILEGRKSGVHTSGLVIGSAVPDELADVMFGHRKFWSRAQGDGEDLFKSLVSLVQAAFMSYLKGR